MTILDTSVVSNTPLPNLPLPEMLLVCAQEISKPSVRARQEDNVFQFQYFLHIWLHLFHGRMLGCVGSSESDGKTFLYATNDILYQYLVRMGLKIVLPPVRIERTKGEVEMLPDGSGLLWR